MNSQEIIDQKVIPANFSKRLAAAIIDIVIIIAIALLVKLIKISSRGLGLETMYFAYYAGCLTFLSTTLGGMLLKINHINNNGEKISKGKAFLKSFIMNIFLLVGLGIYYSNFPVSEEVFIEPALMIIASVYGIISLPIFFTRNKRSIVDLLSGTRVICAPRNE